MQLHKLDRSTGRFYDAQLMDVFGRYIPTTPKEFDTFQFTQQEQELNDVSDSLLEMIVLAAYV